MRKINGASKRGRKKQQGLSNDNFVGGNNKGLSIGPILYQARRIETFPQQRKSKIAIFANGRGEEARTIT